MALLLVVTQALLTQSSPLQKRSVSDKKKLCGTEFSKSLENVCAVYKGYWRVTPIEGTYDDLSFFFLTNRVYLY